MRLSDTAIRNLAALSELLDEDPPQILERLIAQEQMRVMELEMIRDRRDQRLNERMDEFLDALEARTEQLTGEAYTTWGETRGGCGHVHRTRQDAEICIARDSYACKRAGGATDREILRIEPNEKPRQ